MMRWVFLLLPLMAQAQDSRWRLVLPDSLIEGITMKDIRTAATYRLAQDYRVSACVREVVALSGEVASLRIALKHDSASIAELEKSTAICANGLSEVIAERDRWQLKAKRRAKLLPITITLAAVLVAALAIQ